MAYRNSAGARSKSWDASPKSPPDGRSGGANAQTGPDWVSRAERRIYQINTTLSRLRAEGGEGWYLFNSLHYGYINGHKGLPLCADYWVKRRRGSFTLGLLIVLRTSCWLICFLSPRSMGRTDFFGSPWKPQDVPGSFSHIRINEILKAKSIQQGKKTNVNNSAAAREVGTDSICYRLYVQSV